MEKFLHIIIDHCPPTVKKIKMSLFAIQLFQQPTCFRFTTATTMTTTFLKSPRPKTVNCINMKDNLQVKPKYIPSENITDQFNSTVIKYFPLLENCRCSYRRWTPGSRVITSYKRGDINNSA